KSTVLGRAIDGDAVLAAYGSPRFVVSCEGAATARVGRGKAAHVVGVPLGAHLPNRVVSFLRAGPRVRVLVDFETVADGDPTGAAELVATRRAVQSPVVLGLGCRGAAVPAGVADVVEVGLGPLPSDAAVELFVAVAGQRHHQDGNLGALVA